MSNHPGRISQNAGACEDRQAIINFLAAYGHFANIGNMDGWADCFSKDATYSFCRARRES